MNVRARSARRNIMRGSRGRLCRGGPRLRENKAGVVVRRPRLRISASIASPFSAWTMHDRPGLVPRRRHRGPHRGFAAHMNVQR